MKKFYLYTIIVLSLFGAGLVMAGKTNLWLFENDFPADAFPTAGESSNNYAVIKAADCSHVTASITTDKDQTSCKSPNGKLSISISPNNGSYAIEWYESNGLLDPDALVGTGTSVDKLVAGSYVAVIKDNINNCQKLAFGTVANLTPKIEQKVNIINDVIGCEGAQSGILEIEIITEDGSQNVKTIWMEGHHNGYEKNYEFPKWKNMIGAYELPKGTFTVISVNNNTGCFSDPYHITIGQVTPPAVTPTITPNTSCTTGSGAISIVAFTPPPGTQAPGGFSFTWYHGDTTAMGAIIGGSTSTSTSSSIDSLLPGFYTIEVKNNPDDGGCVSYFSFEVSDDADYPSLNLSSGPNTICAETNTNAGFNGSITAAITEKGATVSDFSNYTINWLDENGNPLATNTSGTANVYSNLQDGNYQVSVINNITKCTSGILPVTVSKQVPAIGLNLLATPQTNCEGTPNGSVEVNLTKGGTAVSDYTKFSYKWFQGTSAATGTPISPAMTANKATGLAGGQSYVVVVTDSESGCTSEKMVNVAMDIAVFALAPTAKANTICASSGFDGSITAALSVDSAAATNLAGYAFIWTRPNGTDTTTTTNTLGGLMQGSYQLKVKSAATGCQSLPVTIEVPFAPVPLLVNTVPAPQTNCEGTPNGSVEVNLTKGGTAVTDYTKFSYKWFQGTSAATGTPISPAMTANKATGLAGGQSYVVVVTDSESGCTSEKMVNVAMDIAVFALAPTAKANTICASSGFDGSITAALSVDSAAATNLAGYAFIWTRPNGTDTTTTTNTLGGLMQGSYQLKVKSAATGCQSLPVTIEVPFAPVPLLVNTVPAPQTNCEGTPNGSVEVNLTKGGTAVSDYTKFSYKWFQGTSAATGTPISPAMTANKATGLAGGQSYVVVVTDSESGCTSGKMVNVAMDIAVFALAPTAKANTICASSGFDGSITAALSVDSAAVTNFAGYAFIWTRPNGTDTTTTTNTLGGLMQGSYQLKVKSTATGCQSLPVTIEVPFAPVPLLVNTVPAPQTNCEGTPNGSVEVNLTKGGTAVTDYTKFSYKWFQGTSAATGTPISPAMTANKATGLAGGQSYVVVVTDSESGCTSEKMVNVAMDIAVFALAPTAKANTICASSGFDGSITAALSVDSAAATNLAGYAFIWTRPNGTDTTTTTNTLGGLMQGSYQLKVKSAATGCQSLPVTIEVPFAPVPLLVNTVPAPQTNCEGTPNGSVEVNLTKGGTAVSDYTKFSYKWFQGTSAATGTPISPAMTANKATGLAGGQSYVVVVTDSESGCTSGKMVNVAMDIAVFALAPTAKANTICASSGFDGSITAALSVDSAAVTNFAGYAFIWTRPNGTDTTTTTNTLGGLMQGSYQLKVKSTATGCQSLPVTIEVPFAPVPLLVNTVPAPQTNCEGTPNGSVEVNLTKGGTAVTDYTKFSYKWFQGTSAATGTPISPAMTANKATGLAGGQSYVVVVTDSESGCTSEKMVNVAMDKIFPAITPTTTANAGCVDGKYTGKIELTITENGDTVTNFTGYTISLHNKTDASDITGNTNTFTGLKGGSYTVTVKSPNGCETEEAAFVPEDKADLALILSPTDQSNCEGTDNGKILIEMDRDGAEVTDFSTYTFTVHSGSTITNTPIATISSGNEVSGLTGGQYYTIEVTDNESGCTSYKPVFVPKNLVDPDIALISKANTICSPSITPTGSITIKVENPVSDSTYIFELKNAAGSTLTITGPEGISYTFNGLPEGQYRLNAKSTYTGCTSVEEVIEVGTNKNNPAVVMGTTANIACSAPFTGTAKVMVAGQDNPPGYTYEWYNVTTQTALSQTTNEITAQDQGSYKVTVTLDSTGCKSIAYGTIQTVTTNPEGSVAVSQLISCGQNGALEAKVENPEAGMAYTIIWYRGQNAANALKIKEEVGTTSILNTLAGSSLPADYYTIVVRNDVTRCLSDPEKGYLSPPPPAFNIAFDNIDQPASCNIYGGVVTAYVDNDPLLTDKNSSSEYIFTWYEGGPIDPEAGFYTDPEVDFPAGSQIIDLDPDIEYSQSTIKGNVKDVDYFEKDPNSIEKGQTLYKRAAGVYTVVVENIKTGCKEWKSVTIPYDAQHQGTMTVTDVDDCDANSKGAFIAQVLDEFGNVVANQNGYTFHLFAGSNPGILNQDEIANTPVFGGQDPSNPTVTTISGLVPGWYTLVAVDTLNTCSSIAVSKEIKLIAAKPEVKITNKIHNESCDDPYNGSFTITVAQGEYEPGQIDQKTALFDIYITYPGATADSLFKDNVAADPAGFPLSGLGEGEYAIRVQGLKSDGASFTCDTTIFTTVGKNTPLPVLAASSTDQDECSPPNGSVWVTQVTFEGTTFGSPTPIASDFTDFSFRWYASEQDYLADMPLKDVNGATITAFELSGQPEGIYYVTARRKTGLSAGCPSAPATVEIKNISTLPIISFTGSPTEDCNAPNGKITATVTTNGSIKGPYTFEWFKGESTATADALTGAALGTDGNMQELAGLPEGTYTLKITEGNCTPVIEKFEVESTKSEPYITSWGDAVPNTHCPNGNGIEYNGSFSVTGIAYNGTSFTNTVSEPGKVDNNFYLILYTADPTNPNNTGLAGDTVTSEITGLAPNKYYLVSSKKTNPGIGCGELPFPFTIENKPAEAGLTLKAFETDACDDSKANGSITAVLTENGAAPAPGFTVEWFRTDASGNNPVPLSTAVPTADITNPLVAKKLPAGFYKAVATLANGCPVTTEAEVTQQSSTFNMDFAAVANTACDPLKYNGAYTISNVNYNGKDYTDIDANFSFVYYRTQQDYQLKANGSTATAAMTGLAPGDYYVVATKTTTDPGFGCESTTFLINVPDMPINPVLTLAATPTDACDDSKANGSITAVLTENGAAPAPGFTVEWFRTDASGNNPVPLSTAVPTADITNPLVAKKLPAGFYKAVATLANGCPVTTEAEVIQQSSTFNMDFAAVANTACDPLKYNGAYTISNVNYNGKDYTDIDANFSFVYYRTQQDYQLKANGSTATAAMTGLAPGNYYVVATKTTIDPGFGCGSTEFIINVPDMPINPVLTLAATPTGACDDTKANGSITAVLTENGAAPAPGYTVEWFRTDASGNNPVPLSTAVPTADISNPLVAKKLPAGFYKAVATLANGCPVTTEAEVTQQSSTFNMDFAAVANTACDPLKYNGAYTISNVNYNGKDYTDIDANFSFVYYRTQQDYQLKANGSTATAAMTGLAPGDYYVVATKTTTDPGFGCESTTFLINVPDMPINPVLTLAATPTDACDDTKANGSITAVLTENGAAPAPGYTVEWFRTDASGNNPVPLSTAVPTADITNPLVAKKLPAGFYKAVATLANGCPVTTEAEVTQQSSTFNMDFAAVANTACDPLKYNGAYTISNVNYNGKDYTDVDANFSFVYYRTQQDYQQKTNGSAATAAMTGLAPGNYYVVATKTTIDPGFGCGSTEFIINVPDMPINPVLTLAATPTDACDDSKANGSITAVLTENGAAPAPGFTVEWFRTDASGNNPVPLSTAVPTADISNPLVAKKLPAGFYKAVATLANGCPVTTEAEVTQQSSTFNMDFAAVANTACDPLKYNGAYTISNVNYNGKDYTDIDANFSFVYYRTQQDYQLKANGSTATAAMTGLAPGNYYVVATKTTIDPGFGCGSTEFIINVPDMPINPVLTLAATPTDACDDTKANGSITAVLTENGAAPAPGYTVEWFRTDASGNNPVPLSTAVPTADISNPLVAKKLPAGFYKAVATLANGCPVTTEAEVTQQSSTFNMDFAAVANTACDPLKYNGAYTISNVNYNGKDYTDIDANFSFVYYRTQQDYQLKANGSTATAAMTGLAPGDYYVVATKTTTDPGFGCESTTFLINVPDMPINPVLTLAATPTDACDDSKANGSITAGLTENGAAPAPGYTVTWYAVATDANGVQTETLLPANMVSADRLKAFNLKAGDYKAVATLANGCPVSATSKVGKKSTDIAFTYSTSPQIGCPYGGEVKLEGVTINGSGALLGDFTYNWSKKNEDGTLTPIFSGSTNTALNSTNHPTIDAGIYIVEAVKTDNPAGGCGPRVEIVLPFSNTQPDVNATYIRPISGCNTNSKGIIEVMLTSNSATPATSTIELSWFTSPQYDETRNSWTVFKPTASYRHGDITSIENLDRAYYYAEAIDPSTGCPSVVKSFYIDEFSISPIISASGQDSWHCEPANGEVYIFIANEGEYRQYYPTVNFTVGITKEGDPGFSMEAVLDDQLRLDGFEPGTYYVNFVENLVNGQKLNACQIVSDTVTILDITQLPVPQIVQDIKLSMCDAALANAQLSASVGGTTTGFTYEWFKGEADLNTPSTEAFHREPTASSLFEGIYSVRVTDVITGCQGMASHLIEVDFPVIPSDSAWVLSKPSTSCLEPDGSLEVKVDSMYSNYTFHWYKGPEALADSLIASDVYQLNGLAAGIYSITVTSTENGCTSPAFSKIVEEEYYFPQYKIKITPATCIEDGTAEVVDMEGKIPYYEWYDENQNLVIAPQGTFSGPAGKYWLRIVSDLGCSKMVPVEINSALDPYNAVTMNGDGKNDFFFIDCIQMFPQNRVRIYNRAGTLVYETIGYDNSLNVFAGVGNRGLYVSGNELPVGTYYYVVDKNFKNEKPQTGFLELLR